METQCKCDPDLTPNADIGINGDIAVAKKAKTESIIISCLWLIYLFLEIKIGIYSDIR